MLGLFDSRSLLALGEVKIMGKAWWEASRQSSGIQPDEVMEAGFKCLQHGFQLAWHF